MHRHCGTAHPLEVLVCLICYFSDSWEKKSKPAASSRLLMMMMMHFFRLLTGWFPGLGASGKVEYGIFEKKNPPKNNFHSLSSYAMLFIRALRVKSPQPPEGGGQGYTGRGFQGASR